LAALTWWCCSDGDSDMLSVGWELTLYTLLPLPVIGICYVNNVMNSDEISAAFRALPPLCRGFSGVRCSSPLCASKLARHPGQQHLQDKSLS